MADENESDVKCTNNDGAQQGVLTENQYEVGLQSQPSCSSRQPRLIPQADLSDLVCQPNLSGDKYKHSASRLKSRNPLETDIKLSF